MLLLYTYQPPVRYTVQYETGSGEFVQISNFLPFNQLLANRNLAGGR